MICRLNINCPIKLKKTLIKVDIVVSHFIKIKQLKRCILFLIFLMFACVSHYCSAQQKKAKIALVLSGGGAKGLAHISLLQRLDSLGIVPDLVVGTSMGSILGGLYALGYNGDTLAHISRQANWNRILSRKQILSDIWIEEKSEFGRYTMELDLRKGSLKLPQYLLEDQNLRQYLSLLCFPSYGIEDFDQLPIPFRAVAVDIVNGQEVIIDKGKLYLAMRASMAIPSIFTPLEYENTLLVDGGVLNNFPTDIAQSLGADFIIGSDVGGGMSSREKLESVVSLLFQTGMLHSNLNNAANRSRCDIVVDHVPHLTHSTGDFQRADDIIRQGKVAVDKVQPELNRLAKTLQNFQQRDHRLPKFNQFVEFDTVVFEQITDGNIELVSARGNIRSQTPYEPQTLSKEMDGLMGTTLFKKITYLGFEEGEKTVLKITGHEKAGARFKGSQHYDTERGAGLIIGFTVRNLLGKASRSLMTLDVAETPRGRIQHQQYFGRSKKWWWRGEVYGEYITQNLYLQGQRVTDFRYTYLQLRDHINYTFSDAYLGFGINYEYSLARPRVDPDFDNNPISLSRYELHNLELNLKYLSNTFDRAVFPTKGTLLFGSLSQSLTTDLSVKYTIEDLPPVMGALERFTKLNLEYDHRFTLSSKVSGVLNASLGFSFINATGSSEKSFVDFGNGSFHSLGGIQERPRPGQRTFNGLRERELNVPQFMMLGAGVQLNPWSSIYLTPHFNLASTGRNTFNDYIRNVFDPQGSWQETYDASTVVSGGITLAYNSLLGPVIFDISRVNQVSNFRFFLGVGFQFNRTY